MRRSRSHARMSQLSERSAPLNEKLVEIVAELFDLDPAAVDDALTPEAVELWDSMNHLRLVSAVEEDFGIKLSMQEIESIRSVGALRTLIEQRT
jgi:acyl carrier protein